MFVGVDVRVGVHGPSPLAPMCGCVCVSPLRWVIHYLLTHTFSGPIPLMFFHWAGFHPREGFPL